MRLNRVRSKPLKCIGNRRSKDPRGKGRRTNDLQFCQGNLVSPSFHACCWPPTRQDTMERASSSIHPSARFQTNAYRSVARTICNSFCLSLTYRALRVAPRRPLSRASCTEGGLGWLCPLRLAREDSRALSHRSERLARTCRSPPRCSSQLRLSDKLKWVRRIGKHPTVGVRRDQSVWSGGLLQRRSAITYIPLLR